MYFLSSFKRPRDEKIKENGLSNDAALSKGQPSGVLWQQKGSSGFLCVMPEWEPLCMSDPL